ncbi:hypothetical protein [Vreelandella venusta]|uniref:hypothetical protein n=1 Tax=Vreelandella venusta TaxID=44935 RepID=UPI0018DA7687|nr:hypothetical protein [Halomonas venusta]QPI64468.1 hypothetical protein IR195_01690 [Halomonas venusta]UQI38803.1 hypothetical protein M3L73_11190 [Halomonas venusta]
MNEYEVFYIGERKKGSVHVQAESKHSAKQMARPKINDLAGRSAHITDAINKGPVIDN